jgi:hypothetical protein
MASHVHYARQKMKVFLAAQVLSNSVSDALQYCHAQVPGWERIDVSGTCKYLRIFNMLFDRMNSKIPFGRFLKSPLGTSSKEDIFKDFAAGKEFILSLTIQSSAQRKQMFKESQAAPSPSPIGFIRGGCGSSARIVCKVWLQKQTHSEVVWGVRNSVDFRNGGIYINRYRYCVDCIDWKHLLLIISTFENDIIIDQKTRSS